MTVTALTVSEAGSVVENIDRMGYGSMIPEIIRRGLKTIREATEQRVGKQLGGQRMSDTKPFKGHSPSLAAEFVAHFEGCRLKAYRCPAGVLTIGYGHTGPDVTEGLEIDGDKALELLTGDLRKIGAAIAPAVRPRITEGQYTAILSLAFNIGPAAFKRSSVLRNLNNGAITQAAESFLLWNKAGGKVLPGLVRRRKAERRMFLGLTPAIQGG
jgi:lysozyme